MKNLEQAKYQLSHLLGRAQFLAAMVNLNTKGFANVEFGPHYLNITCEFAPTERDYDSRENEVTSQYIKIDEYIRTGSYSSISEKKREWVENTGNWDDPMTCITRTTRQLREYNAVLESFLTDKGFDLYKHPSVRPYEETIKYTVYSLR
ncbi:hypothetical protein ACWGXJ_02940 [Paenibacillus sp. S33]